MAKAKALMYGRVLEPKHRYAFQVGCSANPVGSFRAGADSLSVTVGQRIRGLDGEEMWDSVTIHCGEQGGELMVRVLVCHPDWDGPNQIACICSQPSGEGPSRSGESISCRLEQVKA